MSGYLHFYAKHPALSAIADALTQAGNAFHNTPEWQGNPEWFDGKTPCELVQAAFDAADKELAEVQAEIAGGAHDSANYPESARVERVPLLEEIRQFWPELRQLVDGFMNGDPNFTDWDHKVRQWTIDMSFKLNAPEAASNGRGIDPLARKEAGIVTRVTGDAPVVPRHGIAPRLVAPEKCQACGVPKGNDHAIGCYTGQLERDLAGSAPKMPVPAFIDPKDVFQWHGDLSAFTEWFGESMPVDAGEQLSIPVDAQRDRWLRVWCGSWIVRDDEYNYTFRNDEFQRFIWPLVGSRAPKARVLTCAWPECDCPKGIAECPHAGSASEGRVL